MARYTSDEMQPSATERLACLEIRGGNERASYSIDLPGMAAWVSCRPITPATRGGDLHYLSVYSQGFVSRITLADVAGHGELVSSVADRHFSCFCQPGGERHYRLPGRVPRQCPA